MDELQQSIAYITRYGRIRHLPGVSDGSFAVDVDVGALVGSIVVNEIVNECLGDATVNLAKDDDDQDFACESVALRTYPFDHFHVPYLNRK